VIAASVFGIERLLACGRLPVRSYSAQLGRRGQEVKARVRKAPGGGSSPVTAFGGLTELA
jgi:hypothetical protein